MQTIACQPNGETPFGKLLANRNGRVAEVPNVNAEAVVYLAISIAWRAHVCTKLPKSTLGKYAEACRLYLLGGDFPRHVRVALQYFEYGPNTLRRRLPLFKKMGPGYDAQLLKVQCIGYQLRLALEKAEQGGPGTFAHRSAWLIAEKAVADLGGMVDVYLPAKALITATGERLMKKR